MKRNFLLSCAFFLSSCASDEFAVNAHCPISFGREISVRFEYGSAELNEAAVLKLKEIARNAREKNDYVCFLGKLSYRGAPSVQALGAVDRVKSTTAVFLNERVDPTKIYVGISAGMPRIGFSEPQTMAREDHYLSIRIGK